MAEVSPLRRRRIEDMTIRNLSNAEHLAGADAVFRQFYAARADPARRPEARTSQAFRFAFPT